MPNTLSNVMADLLASPGVRSPSFGVHGSVYSSRALTTVASSNGVGHIYPLIRIPKHSRIIAVRVGHQDLGAGALMDLLAFESVDWAQTPDGVPSGLSPILDGVDFNLASTGRVLSPRMNQGGPATALGLLFESNPVPVPRQGTTFDICWVALWNPSIGGNPWPTEIDYVGGS